MLAFFVGVVTYAYFRFCDPWSIGWIGNSDQTVPYLAVKILDDWPGLTGLYVAGVYAGSLSTENFVQQNIRFIIYYNTILLH